MVHQLSCNTFPSTTLEIHLLRAIMVYIPESLKLACQIGLPDCGNQRRMNTGVTLQTVVQKATFMVYQSGQYYKLQLRNVLTFSYLNLSKLKPLDDWLAGGKYIQMESCMPHENRIIQFLKQQECTGWNVKRLMLWSLVRLIVWISKPNYCFTGKTCNHQCEHRYSLPIPHPCTHAHTPQKKKKAHAGMCLISCSPLDIIRGTFKIDLVRGPYFHFDF